MKALDLTNVQEAGNFRTLPAGGYIVKIENVEDVADKEYLKVSFDIDEGEFKGFYKDQYVNSTFENKKWAGNFFRSYKENALPFFKGFITAVQNSNKGYKWANDETTLKGKKVGIVLQEEEYIKTMGANAGQVGTRLMLQEVHSVDEIKKGNFTLKPKKTLSDADKPAQVVKQEEVATDYGVTDDDIQF